MVKDDLIIYNNLMKNSFQRRLFRYISEHEPENKNQYGKSLKANYKQVYENIPKLVKYGLIRTVGRKENTVYEVYWLTLKGVRLALRDGIEPSKIRDLAFKILCDEKEKKAVKDVCDYTELMGHDFAVLTMDFLEKGELTIPFPLIENTDKKIESTTSNLKEYLVERPEQKGILLRGLKKVYDLINNGKK